MTITETPTDSATQRATWTYNATEGRYFAAVTLTSQPVDTAGRRGWAWELAFMPAEGVGVHYTGASPADLIRAHDAEPRKVLATLATFVSAWDEAQSYPGSENADLFPASCEPFLGAAEMFALDMDDDQASAEEVEAARFNVAEVAGPNWNTRP